MAFRRPNPRERRVTGWRSTLGGSPSAAAIDLDLGLDEPSPSAAPSDMSLDDLDEPTVPVEGTGDDDDVTNLGCAETT